MPTNAGDPLGIGTTTSAKTTVYPMPKIDNKKLMDYYQSVLMQPQIMQPQILSGNAQAKKQEYKTRIKSRVSIPVKGGVGMAIGSALEMTTAQEGDEIEFTLIIPGRQATSFAIHRKDVEALMGELTLDKLSK